ncbi:peptide-methionine (R)-S-oxide reductase MsrB [Acidisoma cellulosilytica]|uniref:peptide-methionine (R)-S-oxide reductase n=1 Tax=Acidisoma cellulosilyticum TaxID=2802395 RepID=A0A963Z1P9_9PROT|nr:peptide-methionine (R)-S-oxide reductase MsrB [Acidisoma cellulosilyticum]MCB8881203.1 peptide-methionine (R)-S-oxide reductase MsrB [Acidisoma cellulosilyticum]
MARRRELFGLLGLGIAGGGLLSLRSHPAKASATVYPVSHSDAEWRSMLSPAAYTVLRQQGTEAPFSSKLDYETRKGIYACAGCALPVYSSATKYDSHTGWPSFWQPLPKGIDQSSDNSFGMERTEIHCSRCGSHLGHVFPDGPQPTGLRYCMNGVALTFTASA